MDRTSIVFVPIEEIGKEPPPQSPGGPSGERLRTFGVVGAGESGTRVGASVVARLQALGLTVPFMYLDNDYSNKPKIVGPDGQLIEWLETSFVPIGSRGNSRNIIKDFPVLKNRYLDSGALRGVRVWDMAAGAGGGGFPIAAAMDLDLSIARVASASVRFLRQTAAVMAGDNGFWHRVAGIDRAVYAAEEQVPHLILVGSGCGSAGAGLHPLLPYILRAIARKKLGFQNIQITGCVLGPTMFQNLHERTQMNWRATVEQLAYESEHGLKWDFINGLAIDDDAPPYDRVLLFDDHPLEEKATEAELRHFYARVGAMFSMAMTTDLFERVDALTANGGRKTPWATLRAVEAGIDWRTTRELAKGYRSLGRLAELASAS